MSDYDFYLECVMMSTATEIANMQLANVKQLLDVQPTQFRKFTILLGYLDARKCQVRTLKQFNLKMKEFE